MKVLVVGSGGREHAIIWKLNKSDKVSEIHAAPGNGGIAALAKCVDIAATDIDKMVEYAKKECFDMVMVAPDDPLVLGMVDAMEAAGIRVFGPSKMAARIEGSKIFSKELMEKYDIPSAGYKKFEDAAAAREYLESISFPTVIKADGLALGKGVIIAENLEQGLDAVEIIMVEKKFGAAGDKIIIEEFIEGPEVSIITFTDGRTIVPMVSSQDHKRAFDGDKGLNTGGMGTFSPSRYYTSEIAKYVNKNIMLPTIKAMEDEGCPFKGVLYIGIMLTKNGPKVLEYNARFGDPETQVILPLLKTDLYDIFNAIIDGKLDEMNIEWEDGAAVCVVMASGGYPVSYQKGYDIKGIDSIEEIPGMIVFHAGTKLENGSLKTNGGRVLGVVAVEDDLQSAIDKAYSNIDKITFKDSFYRKDIGVK